MKKFFVLLCLVLYISALTGCFSLLPTTPQTDDKNTNGDADTAMSTQIVHVSDKEIALKANHPKYLDDIQNANDIWKNEIETKKVIVVGRYDSVYSDDHIIEISTSEDEDNGNKIEYISSIDIYFSRFDKAVSFEEALNIVATYLPNDTIQQYYKEEMSFSELIGFENQTRYAKAYELKDDSDSDIPKLDTSFGVMIWVDESGNAAEARIAYFAFSPFDDKTMNVWNYNYFAD